MIKAIYPGSFDPITNGHIDIIKRSARTFDQLFVAVSQSPTKKSFLTQDEKIIIIKDAIKELKNVEVKAFNSLLIDFASSVDAKIIVRGLRAVSDFDYEFQLAGMNRQLDKNIETFFMTPSEEFANISSSLVKEIFKLGGDISPFVPDKAYKIIKSKL